MKLSPFFPRKFSGKNYPYPGAHLQMAECALDSWERSTGVFLITAVPFLVDAEKCQHFLEAAADDYNDVQEMAEMLDPDQGGGARKGIMALMTKTLDNEEFIHVWRSCRGGQAPAMGLMYHLAKTKVMTLLKFKELVEATDVNSFRQVINYMNRLMEEEDVANIILDDLDYEYFEKFAKMLSPVPNATHVTKQKTWKNVAGKAGVNRVVVDALDTPTRQDLEQRSLTEEFFRYVSSANPECEVAYIAQGLVDIEREDVVRSCKMFEQCREKGCLKIPSKKAIKDAEEQKRKLEEEKKKIAEQKESIQHAAEALDNFM